MKYLSFMEIDSIWHSLPSESKATSVFLGANSPGLIGVGDRPRAARSKFSHLSASANGSFTMSSNFFPFQAQHNHYSYIIVSSGILHTRTRDKLDEDCDLWYRRLQVLYPIIINRNIAAIIQLSLIVFKTRVNPRR